MTQGGRAQVAVPAGKHRCPVHTGIVVDILIPDILPVRPPGGPAQLGDHPLHDADIIVDDGLAGDSEEITLLGQGVRDFLVRDSCDLVVIRSLRIHVIQIREPSDLHGFLCTEILDRLDNAQKQPLKIIGLFVLLDQSPP